MNKKQVLTKSFDFHRGKMTFDMQIYWMKV